MQLPHLLAACLALLAPAAAAAAPQSGPPTPGQVERAVDGSLRWVRAQQHEDGSYGDLGTTARVLVAFATSHRGYAAGDGPFLSRALDVLRAAQAEDGSVASADADADHRRAQTLVAMQAFELLGAREEARAAAAYLGLEEVALGNEARRRLEPLPTDALFDQAASLLAGRGQDGSWGGDLGRTAEAVRELNALAAILSEREPPKSGEVSALPAFEPADAEAARAAMERGARFLVRAASAPGRWGFGDRTDPGITAMAVGGLLALPEPRPAEVGEAIDSALDWLVSLQHDDGSIHAGQLANYVTSASLMALVAAGREKDRKVVERARDFLLRLQADEPEGYSRGDRYYGGVGYGDDERPDLSNLQMALNALAAAGVESDDAAMQRALVFLQRCQNRSESNDLTVVRDGDTIASGDDGGAGYAPGDSKAGFERVGDKLVPRSYGSMTYALLRGYLLAGLQRDDARVEAAWKWLRSHYTLDVNPGFEASSQPSAAYQGLFYYFLAMAKALDLYGEEQVVDATGNAHPWRKELAGRLVAMQQRDGSWVNDNSARWFEGNPVLATSYALLALGAALPEE